MLDAIFFYAVVGALLGLMICAAGAAIFDFLTRRNDVRRMAWWRHVTGIDNR